MESYLSTHSKAAGFAPTRHQHSSLAKDMKTASYMEMLVAGGPALHGPGEPQSSPMGVTVVLGVPWCSAVGCSFWKGEHEAHFSDIGVAALLDQLLWVKLPMIPGSSNLYYMMKLSEKVIFAFMLVVFAHVYLLLK
ncbi:hypothetical protein MDA_GLEAN10000757 [Myotis davidii]|uniref:Uncharacterized protein n=1 Tax=Myotis davidii TaxID=225400 RepID=L5LWV1_MYODS|nr:hypothetical protein MDA_GLEAN10000757 [Myotis davidii]